MRGFKSFAKKTEMVFGDKFNVVLGPNGAGKSNILDALCFVLGKASAKGMRVERASHLIYNGGKSKQPAKDAEVSIYFDNSKGIFPLETPEVKVTRIIKSSGQSKYKLNGKNRTRQQVLEFLSLARIDPQGYNIILQGDIVTLVEMAPVERRKMVEEISGISVYEDKKEKALRELSRVEDKLNEADIILAERKAYLRELRKDRNQALKFKELDENIKRNKATLLNTKIKAKTASKEKLEKSIQNNDKRMAKIDEQVGSLQEKISKLKLKIENINKEVEEKGEKDQVLIHKEVERLKVDLALNKQRIETLKGEMDKIKERKESLQSNLADIESKIKSLEKEKLDLKKRIQTRENDINLINQKIKSFKEKNKLADAQDIDKAIEDIDTNAELVQEQIQKMREGQQNYLREKDRLEIKLQTIDEKIEKVLSVAKENKKAIDNLKNKKQMFKKATLELNTRLTDDSSLAAQLSNIRSKLLTKKEELAKLKARSIGIKENISMNRALQEILKLSGKQRGIHGVISQLGQVNSQYALALEIAAGARIKAVVVEDDDVATQCIKYLRQNKYGVVTFLPLNKMRPTLIQTELRNLKQPGVIGLAVDLVSYDKKFQKAFQFVFGNTLVVENIETARKIGIGRARMVTLDGDLLELSGAMQGGFRIKTQGLGFQEKEVVGNLQKVETEIADLEGMEKRLVDKRSENELRIDELREQKAHMEGDIIKAEKTLHLEDSDLDVSKGEKTKIAAELKILEKNITDVHDKISSSNTELADFKIKKQQMRARINELRNPALLAELNTFEEKKSQLRDEIMDLNGELKNSDSEITNIILPEKENILKILKQHDKEKEDFENELKALKELMIKQEKSLADKEAKEKKFYNQFKELFNQRTKITEDVTKLEAEVGSKTENSRTFEIQKNNISMEMAAVKAELAGLEEEYKIYEGVALYRDKSEEDINYEIKQFERLQQDIGAVNMRALEIYEQVEKEYDSLTEKKKTLDVERQDIMLMINEIDGKKKELFMNTYAVVNKHFQKIFGTLSTKGEASFDLEDRQDPFNGGLILKVRLAGKKFLDIRSLSGGEKTLTALAFLFAVQEHEPASFYVLDEVDAALDKKNSEKLADLIHSYSRKVQYVMISHNDGIITNAENLYGVSMNEHGISKITSLKI